MIRIKEMVKKKTKVHISFEFSLGEKVIQDKMTMPLKLYETLSEQEVFMRVRAKAMKERLKVGRPIAIEKIEKMKEKDTELETEE